MPPKGAAAREQQHEKTVAKIFADIVDPPIYVDQLGEVKVFNVRVHGSTKTKTTQVNFKKQCFIDANGGEEFTFDIENTDELELQEVLSPKPGWYQVQGYDRNRTLIPRAARYVIVEAEEGDDTGDPDDDDDDDDDDDEGTRDSSDATGIAKIVLKETMRMMREGKKGTKEEPNAVIEMMKDELRSLKNGYEDQIRQMKNDHQNELRDVRTKFEDQIRTMQSKHDAEVQQVWLETKNAITSTNNKLEEAQKEHKADQREWTSLERQLVSDRDQQLRELRNAKDAELRDQRISFEGQMRQMVLEHTGRVQQLESQIMALRIESNKQLLEEQKNANRLEVDRQLALRDAADSQNVAAAIRSQAEQREQQVAEQMKMLATQSAGTAGIIATALPHVKDLITMFKSDGKALPAGNQMNAQSLLNIVASDPTMLQQLRDPAVRGQIIELLGLQTPPPSPPSAQSAWDPQPVQQPPMDDPWGSGATPAPAPPTPIAAVQPSAPPPAPPPSPPAEPAGPSTPAEIVEHANRLIAAANAEHASADQSAPA